MSDDIIDLDEYRTWPGSGRDEGRTFAVWGGEGERTRFALPLWRAIFLCGGERGGITWVPPGGAEDVRPSFVLDLAEDPARLIFPHPDEIPGDAVPPFVTGVWGSGGLAVFLGRKEGRSWFLQILGDDVPVEPEGKAGETLLFLAGECAGLLFYRSFANGTS